VRVLVVLAALGGCSFGVIRSSAKPSEPPPTCTLLVPVVDVGWSFPFALGALAVAVGPFTCPAGGPQASDCRKGDTPAGLALLGVSAAFIASAIYGFHEYGECRRFRREYDAQQDRLERSEDASLKRARDHDRAWELTKQAWAVARAGHCPEIVNLYDQVEALDPDMIPVFQSDAGVRSCYVR